MTVAVVSDGASGVDGAALGEVAEAGGTGSAILLGVEVRGTFLALSTHPTVAAHTGAAGVGFSAHADCMSRAVQAVGAGDAAGGTSGGLGDAIGILSSVTLGAGTAVDSRVVFVRAVLALVSSPHVAASAEAAPLGVTLDGDRMPAAVGHSASVTTASSVTHFTAQGRASLFPHLETLLLSLAPRETSTAITLVVDSSVNGDGVLLSRGGGESTHHSGGDRDHEDGGGTEGSCWGHC